MNIDYNASLVGEYTLYDENMNVLCETENLITDWGMRRFVGDRSIGAPHPSSLDLSQVAFVYNMRYIMLGFGSAGFGTETYTDFRLASAIPVTDYVETNESSTTGTTISNHSSGDMLITFNRLTRFKMASAFNTVTAPTSSYTINEIGCSWTVPTSAAANNRFGIFSRATLATPVFVRPNATIYVKYRLTVRTDANQIKGSMGRFNGTGATSLPANKTNVRDLPLYTLKSDGSPNAVLNFGSIAGTTETGQDLAEWRVFGPNGQSTVPPVVWNPPSGHWRGLEYVPPLFEDAGTFNQVLIGHGDPYYFNMNTMNSTFGPRARRLWWLQAYTSEWSITGALSATQGGANPARRFDTFASTTSANIAVLMPTFSQSITVQAQEDWGFANTGTCSNVSYAALNKPGWCSGIANNSAYDVVMQQNVNLFNPSVFPNKRAARKPADSESLAYNGTNTWTRTVRFLFTPGEMPAKTTVFNLHRATLGNWHCFDVNPGNRSMVHVDAAAAHTFGVVTTLSADYNPNPSLYEGVEYNFTYSRA